MPYTLRLTNKAITDRIMIIEPWTGQYRWPAGSQLDVVLEGDPALPVEIELEDSRLTVFPPDSEGVRARFSQPFEMGRSFGLNIPNRMANEELKPAAFPSSLVE